MNAKHLLDRRKMEKVAEAKDKEIKLLHKELDDLRKELLERKNVELDASDAAEQVSRRDEQLEFLMNVHDAAKDADWVSPAGAPRNAAAALTDGYDDPVAFLEALGVDTATAIAVLDATGARASPRRRRPAAEPRLAPARLGDVAQHPFGDAESPCRRYQIGVDIRMRSRSRGRL